MKNNVIFYKDDRGDTRWRVVAEENGEILAVSSEGYRKHSDAATAARRILLGATYGVPVRFSPTSGAEPDYSALAEGHHGCVVCGKSFGNHPLDPEHMFQGPDE